jgi:hypothetical protein
MRDITESADGRCRAPESGHYLEQWIVIRSECAAICGASRTGFELLRESAQIALSIAVKLMRVINTLNTGDQRQGFAAKVEILSNPTEPVRAGASHDVDSAGWRSVCDRDALTASTRSAPEIVSRSRSRATTASSAGRFFTSSWRAFFSASTSIRLTS